MHGVKRQKASSDKAALEAEVVRKREEAEQIASFSSLSQRCFENRDAKIYNSASLDLTTSLLSHCPDFYTIWAYRRNIILLGIFPASTPLERYKALKVELKLTLGFLRELPKSYWCWGHRMWVLDNVPKGPGGVDGEEGADNNEDGWRNEAWGKELMMTEKMLEADSRNFHAWDYHRYILASLPSTYKPPRTTQTELAFTKRKIEKNFSNYSAWHMRGKVVERMWAEAELKDSGKLGENEEVMGRGREKETKNMKASELELVTQALWVDPKDQSGWLYHRWLIGDGSDTATLRKEIVMVKELLEAEPDSKWPMETLSHYSILLARQAGTSDDEKRLLRQDAKGWYQKLIAIDPFRKERYKELAATCDE